MANFSGMLKKSKAELRATETEVRKLEAALKEKKGELATLAAVVKQLEEATAKKAGKPVITSAHKEPAGPTDQLRQALGAGQQ